jgi:glycosyltransferase involved in cell wall biosynthesis
LNYGSANSGIHGSRASVLPNFSPDRGRLREKGSGAENHRGGDGRGWPGPGNRANYAKEHLRTLMRIFAMINTFDVGGSEGQFVAVAPRLVSRGHQLTVGCVRKRGVYLENINACGIPVVEFSPGKSLMAPSGVAAVLQLALYLRRNNFDVVHTHDLYSNLLGVPAAWIARVPRIVSSRRDLGSWWWYTPRNRRILRSIQRLSDVVVANSHGVFDFLVNQEGFAPEQIRVLHNGVDMERFRDVSVRREDLLPDCVGRPLIVVCANMHEHTKGHEDIIAAANDIRSAFPQCVFVLMGDGELRAGFEQRVRSLGLSSNFRFLGARPDVPAILACCDIGLLASRAEGLPNAVLEYMAAGLPVVATAVGGIPEILGNSGAGLLVPPSDAAALATALSGLLSDPSQAQAMGQRGRRRVQEEFSLERLLDKLENLYWEIKPFSKEKPSNRPVEKAGTICKPAPFVEPSNVGGPRAS